MCQKIWAGPSPPSFGQNPKECIFFSGSKPSLTFKNRWQHFWTWMWTQWTTSRPWKGSCFHSAQCTVQDDEALNSYNIYNMNQFQNNQLQFMMYLIFHLTRFYHEVSTPVQGVCHSLKRFGGRWQANEQVGNNLAGEREKKKETRKWAPEQINR